MNIMEVVSYVAFKSNIFLGVYRYSLSTRRRKRARKFLDWIFDFAGTYFIRSRILTIHRSWETYMENHDLRCILERWVLLRLCGCLKSQSKITPWDHAMVSRSYLRLYSVTAIFLKDLSHQDKRRRMLPLMGLDGETFTVMFDEIATVENRNQMDVLIHY